MSDTVLDTGVFVNNLMSVYQCLRCAPHHAHGIINHNNNNNIHLYSAYTALFIGAVHNKSMIYTESLDKMSLYMRDKTIDHETCTH